MFRAFPSIVNTLLALILSDIFNAFQARRNPTRMIEMPQPYPSILPYGDHHCFTLDIDDLDEFAEGRWKCGGLEYHILKIPGYGYVLNFYPHKYSADYSSVEGYFETLDSAGAFVSKLVPQMAHADG